MKPESEMSDLDPDDVRFINAMNRGEMCCQMALTGDLHVIGNSDLSPEELLQSMPFASLFPNVVDPSDIRTPFH